MTDDIQTIVTKLTEEELDLLKDRFRLDLRNGELMQTYEQLEATRRRIWTVEERALRKLRQQRGEDPHCSFCNKPSAETGSLCQSERGPYICLVCAHEVVSLLGKKE
jgi:hypothetical protein